MSEAKQTELCVSNLEVPGILHNINFSAKSGQIMAVVGSSGSGKSTLVHAIAGLTDSTGALKFDESDLTDLDARKRPTALAPQQAVLFPNLSVSENVGFGLDSANMPKMKRSHRIDIALADLNISSIKDALPQALSGGQIQRVSLARALAMQPRILLLDEPLAHLDVHIRPAVQRAIIRNTRRYNIVTIYVTHDIDEACAIGNQLGVLKDGTFLQVDSPRTVYERPSSRAVAQTMGIENIFSCFVRYQRGNKVLGVDLGSHRLELAGIASPGSAIICIPPTGITIGSHDANAFNATVIRVTFQRHVMEYDLETEFGTLVAYQPHNAPCLKEGDNVSFSVDRAWIINEADV